MSACPRGAPAPTRVPPPVPSPRSPSCRHRAWRPVPRRRRNRRAGSRRRALRHRRTRLLPRAGLTVRQAGRDRPPRRPPRRPSHRSARSAWLGGAAVTGRSASRPPRSASVLPSREQPMLSPGRRSEAPSRTPRLPPGRPPPLARCLRTERPRLSACHRRRPPRVGRAPAGAGTRVGRAAGPGGRRPSRWHRPRWSRCPRPRASASAVPTVRACSMLPRPAAHLPLRWSVRRPVPDASQGRPRPAPRRRLGSGGKPVPWSPLRPVRARRLRPPRERLSARRRPRRRHPYRPARAVGPIGRPSPRRLLIPPRPRAPRPPPQHPPRQPPPASPPQRAVPPHRSAARSRRSGAPTRPPVTPSCASS